MSKDLSNVPVADRASAVVLEKARHAKESAEAAYQNAKAAGGQLVTRTSDTIRANPVPVIVGAAVLGAAVGYLLLSSRRKTTVASHFVDVDALRSALAPFGKRLHEGYGAAIEKGYDSVNFAREHLPEEPVKLLKRKFNHLRKSLNIG